MQKFDSQEEENKVLSAVELLRKLPIIHINNPAWTVDTMEATIKKWHSKVGIDLVIMDYIKAPDTDDAYVELGKITNFLKNKVAGAMDMSVIAAAQSNRGGDTGESYRIEQYCSTLVKIVEKTSDEINKDGIDCGRYKLFVSLNRNEKGKEGNKTALDEVKELYGFETAAIVSMPEVVECLHNKEVKGKVVINDEIKERIDAYYELYGVK